MSTLTVSIKQLTSRLESSVSSERIEALQELQVISRTSPGPVGELAIKNVFDLLRSQSNSEEYSEALDLTSRLIKSRDREAALANTARILEDESNVELLLDLLEHSDVMVGIMTSEILTELHSNDNVGLESQIQRCPDGMNKLLQRLPDSSREEVRNQAIVLIRQLTSTNEEMKKTVVFNEGFDILFRIISEEGGSGDAGLVVSDCLKICNNILMGSETCQRLFFAMGIEWILRLADFFNPMILESMEVNSRSLMDGDAVGSVGWFDESNRLSCAVLAVAILSNGLQFHNVKHQNVIADGAAQVLQSSLYWVGRNGPAELLVASLSLFDAVVQNNPNVAHVLSSIFIKIAPNSRGKNITSDAEAATLLYAWKPLPNDERRCISLLALLAERYVHGCKPWRAPAASIIHGDLGFQSDYDVLLQNEINENSVQNPFLLLFHRITSVDTTVSDTLVQYVLAPPPPTGLGDDDEEDMYQPMSAPLESMRPVCSILLQTVVQYCEKLLTSHVQYNTPGLGGANGSKSDIEIVEKVSHVLTVVFMNGSLLGRELCTAITTSHCATQLDSQDKKLREVDADNKAILPFIMAAIGRAARLPGGLGYPLVKAVIMWLATVVCGCERATRMVFEDPANLFVVDLATSSSESAGVPSFVQVSACFFLGCCLLALPPDQPEADGNETASSGSVLKRKALLTVIDSRIGLNRFTETLKKPLLASRKQSHAHDNFFLIPGFRAFYEEQVQRMKDLIFEMYSGATSGGGVIEGANMQIIQVQKAKIEELEAKLKDLQAYGGHGSSNGNGNSTKVDVEALEKKLRDKEEELQAFRSSEEALGQRLQETLHDLQGAVETSEQLAQEVNILQQALDEKDRASRSLIEANEKLLQEHHALGAQWKTKEEKYEDNVVHLKETILKDVAVKKALEEAVEQKDKKIYLLESELTALQTSRAGELSVVSESRLRTQQVEELLQKRETEFLALQREHDDLVRVHEDAVLSIQQLQSEANASQGRLTFLEEAMRSLQTDFEKKLADLQELTAQNDSLQKKLDEASAQATVTPVLSLTNPESIPVPVENEELLKIRDHLARLIDEVMNTEDSLGHLPEAIQESDDEGDVDGFEETSTTAATDRALLKAIQKLQNIRLAISFVAGECSDFSEGANLNEIPGTEGTLEKCLRCCEKLALRVADLADVEEGVEELKAALNLYELKFTEVEADKESFENREQQLQVSLQASKEALERATMHLHEKLGELQSLQSQLVLEREAKEELRQQSAKEHSQLLEQVSHLTTQLELAKNAQAQNIEREKTELKARIVALENDLQTVTDAWEGKLRQEKEDHLQQINKLEAAMLTSQATHQEEFEQLKLVHSQQVSVLETNMQALQAAHLEQLEHEKAPLLQQIATLERDLQKSTAALHELEESHQQESHTVLSHLRHKLKDLEDELDREKAAHLVTSSDRDRVVAESKATAEVLKTKMEQLKDQQKEVLTLQNKVIALQEEVQHTAKIAEEQKLLDESMISQLETTIGDLKFDLTEKDDGFSQKERELLSHVELLTQEKDELDSTLEDLRMELEVEKQLSVTLREESNEATAHIGQLENEIHQLRTQLKDLQDHVHETKQLAAKESQQQLEQTKSELEMVLQSTKEQLQAANSVAASERMEAQKLIDAIQSLQVNHEAEVTEIRRALEDKTHLVLELEQRVLVLQESNDHKAAALMQKDEKLKALAATLQAVEARLADKVEELEHVKEVHEQERAAKKAAVPSVPVFNNTVQLQDLEIRRLSTTVERLSKEVQQKEQDLRTLQLSLTKKEGELSTSLIQAETLKEEIAHLQSNIDALNQSLNEKNHVVTDLNARLTTKVAENKVQSVGRFAEYNVLPTSERMQVTEAMHLLYRFMLTMNEKYNIHDHFQAQAGRDLSTQDLPDLATALKTSLQDVVSKMDAEVDGFANLLAAKEKEISSLKAQMAAAQAVNTSFSSSAAGGVMISPVRGSASAHAAMDHSALFERSAEKPSNRVYSTPSRARRDQTPTSDKTKATSSEWDSAEKSINRRSQTVTPSAKEAAKYHAELIRERKKLVVLQEEHADLLGLIAQQEVELSVFKSKLATILGESTAAQIEMEARDSVEKQYGIYTNFREPETA